MKLVDVVPFVQVIDHVQSSDFRHHLSRCKEEHDALKTEIQDALHRFDDEGNAGVFVKVGVEITFKKIKVIVNEGDYAIVEDTTEDNGYLSLYDLVVTEGNDLYDGKIILQ